MDALTSLIKALVVRWTAESPTAYKTVTDIALGVGIAASALPILLPNVPVWIISGSSIIVAIAAKLTVK